ncbi:efflux RND transporter periplasmic adaptor subunit [Desulforhopalus sp. IMCC35007]|uniref:efflux RND transporter periplasmic adaptor subunit n=1 Tax=Desulforhopalus sp. IMCC35007 TaxID=2569543 RepID=UPI0010AECBC7|nr:biotin/lipoyl-binding protein [Desulforhopalus sp. IMCC35007]TKB10436.1 biotin/lipoyl-binding protein [Desulforhopalus sp. IMCC35007]
MKKIIWLLIAVLLIGGAVVLVKKKRQAMADIPPMKLYHQVVEVMTPTIDDIVLTLPALSEVKSDQDVELSSKLSARITSMVKSGDTVKKGQVVATLDHADLLAKKEAIVLQVASLEAEITAQKIALDAALQSHKRTKVLLDARGASVEQYDSEASKIASLEAGLKGLSGQEGILKQNSKEVENLLSYAVILSPIDGAVSSTSANVGVIAMPGKPLLSIQADSGKYLLIRTTGDMLPTEVIFEGLHHPLLPLNHTYKGLDEYRADVETKSSSGERLPVRLVVYKGAGTMIPLSALLQKEGQNLCFIPEGEKAIPVPVKVIASGTEGVVVEGLQASQIIVAKPDILLKLLAGTPITVKK